LLTQIIDIDSGQKVESWLTLPQLQDPQKMISATTYYRRATLQALLSLQAVDDDGNSIKVSSKPTVTDEQFKIALEKIQNGKYTIEKLKENYSLTKEQEAQL
jgi:hypothetical protein